MSLILRFTQTEPNPPPGGATQANCSCFHGCVPCISSVVIVSLFVGVKTKICRRTPSLLVSDCVFTQAESRYLLPGSGAMLWHTSSKPIFRCPLNKIRSERWPECFSD